MFAKMGQPVSTNTAATSAFVSMAGRAMTVAKTSTIAPLPRVKPALLAMIRLATSTASAHPVKLGFYASSMTVATRIHVTVMQPATHRRSTVELSALVLPVSQAKIVQSTMMSVKLAHLANTVACA